MDLATVEATVCCLLLLFGTKTSELPEAGVVTSSKIPAQETSPMEIPARNRQALQ